MKMYGLEYNEKHHWFHRTDKHDNFAPAKATGWVTIFTKMNEDNFLKFCDLVDTLYPDKRLLLLKQVKRLRKAFIKLMNK